MCLDFGTSFSKAFACSVEDPGDVPDLYPLSFGMTASGDPRLLLPSELFIDDGLLYLGVAARVHFDDVQAPQDRLIDSPKQFITLASDVTGLHRRRLAPEQDPGEYLTQRDTLVLYLAHLNMLAETAARDHGLNPNMKRRYAHPAWTEDHFEANRKAMNRIVAEAIAISRGCAEELTASLPLTRAVEIAGRARNADDANLPFGLIDDPVLEATAAGAGALVETPRKKRVPYVVLDIGAGTTDVAGCLCINNPAHERVKVAEVRPAATAIKLAGNVIDNALLKLIMLKSSLSDGTAEHRQAHAALKRTIRSDKEVLFSEGNVVFSLVTGDIIDIDLREFRRQPVVQKLFAKITEIVKDAAFHIAGDESVVYVAATGGGANLPVVRELDNLRVRQGDKTVRLKLTNAMSRELTEKYPQLEEPYPQIAVAVGGALPDLPEQISSIQQGISDPGKVQLRPVYKS